MQKIKHKLNLNVGMWLVGGLIGMIVFLVGCVKLNNNLTPTQNFLPLPTIQTPLPAPLVSNLPAISSSKPTVTPKIDTLDWKTYKDEKHGISLIYPGYWGNYNRYTEENMEKFEKDRGITYYFENNPNVKMALESKDFKLDHPGSLYDYLLDGVPVSFKQVTDIDKYCTENKKESLLCEKYNLSEDKSGILEDRIFCLASPTGGGINCSYYRFFFTVIANKDFPVFVLSARVGTSDYNDPVYKECDYDKIQNIDLSKNCFKKNYKAYFIKHEKELSELSKIISSFKFAEK